MAWRIQQELSGCRHIREEMYVYDISTVRRGCKAAWGLYVPGVFVTIPALPEYCMYLYCDLYTAIHLQVSWWVFNPSHIPTVKELAVLQLLSSKWVKQTPILLWAFRLFMVLLWVRPLHVPELVGTIDIYTVTCCGNVSFISSNGLHHNNNDSSIWSRGEQ